MTRHNLPQTGAQLTTIGVRCGFFLFVLMVALLSGGQSARAAEPVTTDGEPTCAECHSLETNTWSMSHHAAVDAATGAAAATCTDCHGPYTEQHPDDDLMALDVSSATCATCHTATYTQWEATIHAQNEVQCIGCHQAHSQELRLGAHTLCTSCHTTPQSDPFHKAHWLSDTACTDCHMSGEATDGGAMDAPLAALEGVTQEIAQRTGAHAPAAPAHDFVSVSARLCLDCHRDDVQASAQNLNTVETRLLESEQTKIVLSNRLEATESNLRAFQGLTPVALGLGLGLGGMLGIVFMLVIAGKDVTLNAGAVDEQTDLGDES